MSDAVHLDDLLTRTQAAELAGCSIAAIRRREGLGILKPHARAGAGMGMVLYTREGIEEHFRQYPLLPRRHQKLA